MTFILIKDPNKYHKYTSATTKVTYHLILYVFTLYWKLIVRNLQKKKKNTQEIWQELVVSMEVRRDNGSYIVSDLKPLPFTLMPYHFIWSDIRLLMLKIYCFINSHARIRKETWRRETYYNKSELCSHMSVWDNKNSIWHNELMNLNPLGWMRWLCYINHYHLHLLLDLSKDKRLLWFELLLFSCFMYFWYFWSLNFLSIM